MTESEWSVMNRERGKLIDKSIAGTLTDEERVRLDRLNELADQHIEEVAPRSTNVLEELEKRIAETEAT